MNSTEQGIYAELSAEVAAEETRLALADEIGPFGGWRNRAVSNVAERHGMNPYTLSHGLTLEIEAQGLDAIAAEEAIRASAPHEPHAA